MEPCFPLKEEEELPIEKENTVTYMLKVRANSTGQNTQTYKRILRRFNEGTAEAFIKTLQALEEIWAQNLVTNANDREATVKTVLRGASLEQFEARLAELTSNTDEEGNPVTIPLTVEHVKDALNEVGRNVFPHRALENQKQWMRRHLRKPSDMPIRKMASSIVRINNYLPYLPGATENDKFSDVEVVELLEFSLPHSWRAKFDLEGFVPTQNDRQELVRKCEALERSLTPTGKVQPTKRPPRSPKHKVRPTKNNSGEKYCITHGKGNHSSEECRNPVTKKKLEEQKNRSFNKKRFQNEVNKISTFKKKQALDNFAAVIKAERKKLKENNDSDDSSSELSLGNVEPSARLFRTSKKVTFKKKGRKSAKPKISRTKSHKKIIKALKDEAVIPKIVDKEPTNKFIEPNSPKLKLLTVAQLRESNVANEADALDKKKLVETIAKARENADVSDKVENKKSTTQNKEAPKDTSDGQTTNDLIERLNRLGMPLTDAPDEEMAGAQNKNDN